MISDLIISNSKIFQDMLRLVPLILDVQSYGVRNLVTATPPDHCRRSLGEGPAVSSRLGRSRASSIWPGAGRGGGWVAENGIYRWLQMATDGCRCDDHDFEFLV